MPRAVHRIEIERCEARADICRPAHPVQHRVDALTPGHRLIETLPVGRALFVNFHLAARPEHGSGPYALLFGGDPDRLRLIPPEGIERLFRIAEREFHVWPARIDHRIADDAIIIGPLASDERVVIGKGLGRKTGPHRRAGALGSDGRDVLADPTIQIVGAKAVDAYQDDRRGRVLGCRVRGRRGFLRRGRGGDQRQDQQDQFLHHLFPCPARNRRR